MTTDPTISLYVYNTVEAERDRYRNALAEIRSALKESERGELEQKWFLFIRLPELLDEYLPLEAGQRPLAEASGLQRPD